MADTASDAPATGEAVRQMLDLALPCTCVGPRETGRHRLYCAVRHREAAVPVVAEFLGACEAAAERRALRDLAAMCVGWTVFGAGIGVVLVTVLLRVTS